MAADSNALARTVEGRIRSSGSFSGVAGLRLGGEERMTIARGRARRLGARTRPHGESGRSTLTLSLTF